MVPFRRLTRERQRLIINSQEVPGIQSAQLNYALNASPAIYLGLNSAPLLPRGNQIGQASFEGSLISHDPFIAFTGNSGMNGFIIEERPPIVMVRGRPYIHNFHYSHGFISGFMDNYNQSCSIGEVPKISTNLSVYGDIGTLDVSTHPDMQGDWALSYFDPLSYTYKPMSYGSIILGINELNTDRVISYSIDINVNRIPVYIPGYRLPKEIQVLKPVEVTCSFQIEIDKYLMSYLSAFPQKESKQNIQIELKNLDTNDTVLTYNFNNMSLFSENLTSAVEGNVLMNMVYKVFYT